MSARLSLACVLFAAATSLADEYGKRVAVCVGVNAYDDPKLPGLKYAEADATEFRDVLKGAGYVTYLYTGAEGKKDKDSAPTKTNVEAIVRAVLKGLTNRDLLIIALVGHGVRFEATGDSYFCPQDAVPTKQKADTMISLTDLLKQFDDSKVGVKFLIVDACRNDPKSSSGVTGDSAPLPPPGVAALYGCKDSERLLRERHVEARRLLPSRPPVPARRRTGCHRPARPRDVGPARSCCL